MKKPYVFFISDSEKEDQKFKSLVDTYRGNHNIEVLYGADSTRWPTLCTSYIHSKILIQRCPTLKKEGPNLIIIQGECSSDKIDDVNSFSELYDSFSEKIHRMIEHTGLQIPKIILVPQRLFPSSLELTNMRIRAGIDVLHYHQNFSELRGFLRKFTSPHNGKLFYQDPEGKPSDLFRTAM